MSDLFNWVELQTGDLSKAKDFYHGLFGWEFDDVEMLGSAYTMVKGKDAPAAGMMQNSAAAGPSHWLPYIDVENVDAATAKALGLGATTVVDPTDIPSGRFSVIVDPAGAAIGLAQVAAMPD